MNYANLPRLIQASVSKQESVFSCSIQHPPCRRIIMSSSISSRSSSVLVPPDTKKICELYFGKNPVVGSESKWKCTCGTVRSQNIKLGYLNLVMSHIKQKHTNYLDMFVLTEQANEDRQEAAGHGAELSGSTNVITTGSGSMSSISGHLQQTTLNFMMDTKSNNVFKWLEWIVMDEHILIFVKRLSHDATQDSSRSP